MLIWQIYIYVLYVFIYFIYVGYASHVGSGIGIESNKFRLAVMLIKVDPDSDTDPEYCARL